jgi:TRAP-type C4-dicarboxylate transport system permease small subunit
VRRPIDLATAAVNWTVSFFAGLAAAALLLMVLVTVGNIGLRVAATPYNGTYEIVGMLSVLVSGLALAEAQRHKTHIAIDLVMSRRSVRVQLLVGAVVTAVSAVMFALVAQELVSYGLNLRARGAATESLRLPYWPLSLALAAGVLVLALALVSDLLQIVRNLRSRNPESIW